LEAAAAAAMKSRKFERRWRDVTVTVTHDGRQRRNINRERESRVHTCARVCVLRKNERVVDVESGQSDVEHSLLLLPKRKK
jgi:hypothetical protein